MTQLLNCMPTLRELTLFLGSGIEVNEVLGWLGHQTQLEELRICCNSMNGICGLLGSLPRLSRLEFRGCLQMQELPPGVCSCQNLERLALVDCPNLSSLPANIGSMSGLRFLGLVHCGSLSSVPESLSSLQLQRVVVAGCHPDLVPSLPPQAYLAMFG
jgi:Leucine-rich repeat (LRR) protein